VSWEPGGSRLDWSWADGLLKVTVPQLRIHGAVVWE